MAPAKQTRKPRPKKERPTAPMKDGFPLGAEIEKQMTKDGSVTLGIVFDKAEQKFVACSLGMGFVTPLLVDPGQPDVGAVTKPRIAFKGFEWSGRLYPTGQAVFQRSNKKVAGATK